MNPIEEAKGRKIYTAPCTGLYEPHLFLEFCRQLPLAELVLQTSTVFSFALPRHEAKLVYCQKDVRARISIFGSAENIALIENMILDREMKKKEAEPTREAQRLDQRLGYFASDAA